MDSENGIVEKSSGELEIKACDNLPSKNNLQRLALSSAQKIHVNALLREIPSIMTTTTLANAYVLSLPNGVTTSDLMHYAGGGLGTPYFGENGIAGHAALQSIRSQAVLMGAFTAMSVASGQYFLSEINSNLKDINQKADKILEFLYGDKKAELMSEVNFVNSAYQNYNSIMVHEHQKIATIIGLQGARKVAMKDIEFYMSDLDSLAKTKDITDLDSFVNKAFKIKECLLLATQLYCMSNILEIYYSQNMESDYVAYVEKEILAYIDKCEKRLLSGFTAIRTNITTFKGNLLKKIDKSVYEKRVGDFVDALGNGREFIERKPLQDVLQFSAQKHIYYLNKEGEVYLKTA